MAIIFAKPWNKSPNPQQIPNNIGRYSNQSSKKLDGADKGHTHATSTNGEASGVLFLLSIATPLHRLVI